MGKCSAITHSGERCRAIAITGSDYCHAHHPGRAEQRKRNAKIANKRDGRGRPSPQSELNQIKARISKLAEDVLEGNVKRADAAVAGQLLNCLIRAVGMELRAIEQLEVLERIEELEEIAARQNEYRSQAW